MDRTLVWQIAFRYLRGKRSANAVPVLSRISMVAIAVSCATMIIVFSVFNGLEGMVRDLYKGFYPDMRVSAEKGKFFPCSTSLFNRVEAINGVEAATRVLGDKAIVNRKNASDQKFVTLKGIDKNYFIVNDIREYIAGEDSVTDIMNPVTVIAGERILNELGVDVFNVYSLINIYYPNPYAKNFNDISNAYRSVEARPAGAFRISDEFDDQYMLAPISVVQTLLHREGQYSSVEVRVQPGREKDVRVALKQLFGTGFKVENRYEQNHEMFAVMHMEKWVIYAILVMVLLIASFNMVGALAMLVLEKQKDMAILRAMGAEPVTIRNIFLLEGVLWALVGGGTGILLGWLICLLQQHYGIVGIAGSFMMDAYPVDMNMADFLLVLGTIIFVGLAAAWYPARRAARAALPALKGS